MNRRYPTRPRSHNLEELSERYFNENLPENWTTEKPESDYGVDLRVDIFEGEYATGLELLIQLKASDTSVDGENESIRLRTATYNHLWDKLQVVMLVKYIANEDEAYWLLLSQVPEPNQDQDTFTVSIPKQNKLSNIDWEYIKQYIREVTDEKLAVRRRNRLRRD